MQPRVLAAVYSRCDTSIEEHGVNCDLLWSAAGDHVAVLVRNASIVVVSTVIPISKTDHMVHNYISISLLQFLCVLAKLVQSSVSTTSSICVAQCMDASCSGSLCGSGFYYYPCLSVPYIPSLARFTASVNFGISTHWATKP